MFKSSGCRFVCLDGLKGIASVFVCFLHFLLVFNYNGYVGWMCADAAANDRYGYFFSHFPYSILTNYTFPLYVFMALISFIPALKFFQTKKTDFIIKQAVSRYFRFMPMVFAGCLISVLMYNCGLFPFSEFKAVTGNNWAGARDAIEYSLFNAFSEGLFLSFINGTQLVASLWCIYQLFIGSFLSYAVLILFGSLKQRYIIYLALVMFLYSNPTYVVFLAGIASADIYVNTNIRENIVLNWGLFFSGLALSMIPIVCLPGWLDQIFIYAVACTCLCLAVVSLFKENKFLCSKYLLWIGKESFSFIIAHSFVLFGINLRLYISLVSMNYNPYLVYIANLLVFVIFTSVFSYIFGKLVNPISNFLCRQTIRFNQL